MRVINWIKSKLKWFLLGGVVLAAPLLLPKVDINEYQVPPIVFDGKEISFPCTDGQDHTGETVAIRSDLCEISTWGGQGDNVYVHVAVSNLSTEDQNFQIQGFHKNGSRFEQFEELKFQVPHQKEVTDFSDVKYECSSPWEVSKEPSPFVQYTCPDFKEAKFCKTVEKNTCTVSEPTGTHLETYYKDEYGSITKNPEPDSALDLTSKKREPQYMFLKEQFQYWIPSGQTKYFRAKLAIPHGRNLDGKFTVKAFGSLGAKGSLDPVWYVSTWGYHMPFTADYTQIGTGTALTSFPLTISTTSPNLKHTAHGGNVGKTDGTDIVITEADGFTKLSHQIEKYNSSTGETIIHFKSSATTALSTSTNTTYRMFYGNASASDQQDASNVFDSNNVGIWHLRESPDGSSGQVKDSTATQQNGTTSGMDATNLVAGKVGDGYNFASGDSVAIADAVELRVTNSFTFSLWFKPTNRTGGGQYAFNKGNYWAIIWEYVDNQVEFFSSYYTGTNPRTGVTIPDTNWHHVAFAYNGTNWSKFVDGVETVVSTSTTFALNQSADSVSIGGFLGSVDELKVAKTARSAAWIKTEYNNQGSPGTFWSWGSQIATDYTTTGYGYYIPITINKNKVASSTSETYANFPLTVSTTLTSLKTVSNGGRVTSNSGYDIVFATSTSGSTILSHELEMYASSTGELIAYVKMPSISTSTDTTIYMFYGNSNQAYSLQDFEGTWSNSYEGIFHLANGTTLSGFDSTLSGNDMTTTATVTATSLKLDGAANFDGNTSYLSKTGFSGSYSSGGTVSWWMNPNSSTASDGYVADSALVVRCFDNTNISCTIRNTAAASAYSVTGTSINTSTIQMYTMTWDGSSAQLYENDTLDGQDTTITGTLLGTMGNLFIGNDRNIAGRSIDGKIDEVRISTVKRTVDWIKTDYCNQAGSAVCALLTFGSEVSTASGSSSPPIWYNNGNVYINGNVLIK